MDQALITFQNQLTEEVQVYYTSDYCHKCVYQLLARVKPNNSSSSVIVSTKFTLTIQVDTKPRNNSLCKWSQTYGEGGQYLIDIGVSEVLSEPSCRQIIQKSPKNVYLPLLVAALVFVFLSVLFATGPYIYRRRNTSKFIRAICCRSPQYSMDNNEPPESDKPKSARLQSLDTFRGFALTIMVFVNYGGGGYWFFQHAPWNGLTVADLVMPWFVFIIGTSVVLAFTSMQRRGVGRGQLIRKVAWRTLVLLLLGFCFLNYSPRDGPLSWSWLRVPGVLQRLGVTYLVLSLLQTFWGQISVPLRTKPFQDLTLYWPQWLIMVLLETLWLCLTFLLPVPNCPTGYLGAGGIGDDGLYPNCTGGAAGLIDRWMFGDNMFRYPTCREMYQTTQPFDPEGILGTINSVLMGFLGMQAGKIIIFYRGSNVSILGRFVVWAVLLGISAAILTKCTRDAGFIPVNKNLWSLSFVTCLGCFSFLLLGAMYFIIDVRGWWRGQPFIYPGTNSILVYVGHSLLGFYFPFSWDMRLWDSHWELLFMNLWGTALWVLISYLLYRKRFFLKI
ncbi:heparan-alpha-glucosaminide N-acetyltransferase [Periophthalmus magnuspinnatus]|uniref:heparan-alpha-glucosaminide N-acetyltransferase n=1 Tax=Periophthalmus magnuspinnatus TaxID=409849 RepID=UPI002436B21F|nr:heparan-alpha-glucosaminide N-acetyltransferase [Periophthalmus magnuspinnatus]